MDKGREEKGLGLARVKGWGKVEKAEKAEKAGCRLSGHRRWCKSKDNKN